MSVNVVDYVKPSQLREKMDFSLGEKGVDSLGEIEEMIAVALKYSVRTSHPGFYDKLYSGSEPIGIFAPSSQ